MRILQKETIAKNLINSSATMRQIELIPNVIAEGCDNIDKEIAELKHKKKILFSLSQEFLNDKIKFIEKYAKPKRYYHSEPIHDFLKKERLWKVLGNRIDKKSKSN